MNLEGIKFNVLLCTAIKAEIESREVYEYLASRVKNLLIRD